MSVSADPTQALTKAMTGGALAPAPQGVWTPMDGLQFSWQSGLTVLIIFAVGYGLSLVCRRVLVAVMRRRSVEPGMIASFSSLMFYTVIAITAYTGLVAGGVPMGAFTALGAALMVGIGFGMQNIMQNFIAGVILLMERPVQVGDFIQLGDLEGRIEEIRFRITLVRTRDARVVLVPNSDLIKDRLINLTHMGQTSNRQVVRVGVAYDSDPKRIQEILLEIASRHPDVQTDPEPTVQLESFLDSSLSMALWVTLKEQWPAPKTLSDIRIEIHDRFQKEGVMIPFPQRVVHVKADGEGENSAGGALHHAD